MSRLSYRPAEPADLPFIIGLIVDDSVTPTGDDPADAMHTDYVRALEIITADSNQDLYVAELDGARVGCFQLTYIPGLMRRGMWRGLIEAVHIVPDKRSLGLGGEMIGFAVERAKERGCGLVQLTSNKARLDAHRFYRRLGFEQTHEGFKLTL